MAEHRAPLADKSRRSFWGGYRTHRGAPLVLAWLCGCAGASTRPPSPAAHPAQRTRVAPPDPEGTETALTKLEALEPAPTTTQEHLAIETQLAKTRDGAIALQHWSAADSAFWRDMCAREACVTIRTGRWRAPAANDGVIASWDAPAAAPIAWSEIHDGEHAAYARRYASELVFDRIDVTGEVRPLCHAAGMRVTAAPVMLDVGTHVVLLIEGPVAGRPLSLALARVDGSDGNLTLKPRALPFLLMPQNRPVVSAEATAKLIATQSREDTGAASAQKQHIVVGPRDAAAWRDENGELDGTWVMSWFELDEKGKRPSKQSTLGDEGVTKRAMLGRFKTDGTMLATAVLSKTTTRLADVSAVRIIPARGGVSAGGVVLDGALKGWNGAVPPPVFPPVAPTSVPPVIGAPIETIVGGGYDVYSGEGIAVVGDVTGTRSIRFDAFGQAIGAPIVTQAPSEGGEMRARRIGGAWMLVPEGTHRELETILLTGPFAGKLSRANMPGGLFTSAVYQGDSGAPMVVRFGALRDNGDADDGQLSFASLAEDGTVGEWTPAVIPQEIGTITALLAVPYDDHEHPRFVVRLGDGAIAMLRGTPETALVREGIPLFGTGALRPSITTHELWDETVVRTMVTSQDHVTWLSSGLTLPVTHHTPGRYGEPQMTRGPLLAGGVLSSKPDASLRLDDLEVGVINDCTHAFATGPRRAVLLCYGPSDAPAPSRRVGTRTLRW